MVVDGTLVESETLVAKVGDGCLDEDFLWIEYRRNEVGINMRHNDGYVIVDILSHYIEEILRLTHVEEGEIDIVVYMSKAVNIRESQLCRHLMSE